MRKCHTDKIAPSTRLITGIAGWQDEKRPRVPGLSSSAYGMVWNLRLGNKAIHPLMANWFCGHVPLTPTNCFAICLCNFTAQWGRATKATSPLMAYPQTVAIFHTARIIYGQIKGSTIESGKCVNRPKGGRLYLSNGKLTRLECKVKGVKVSRRLCLSL